MGCYRPAMMIKFKITKNLILEQDKVQSMKSTYNAAVVATLVMILLENPALPAEGELEKIDFR